MFSALRTQPSELRLVSKLLSHHISVNATSFALGLAGCCLLPGSDPFTNFLSLASSSLSHQILIRAFAVLPDLTPFLFSFKSASSPCCPLARGRTKMSMQTMKMQNFRAISMLHFSSFSPSLPCIPGFHGPSVPLSLDHPSLCSTYNLCVGYLRVIHP